MRSTASVTRAAPGTARSARRSRTGRRRRSPSWVPSASGAGTGARRCARWCSSRRRVGRGLQPGVAIAWAYRHIDMLAELEPALTAAYVRITDGAGAVR